MHAMCHMRRRILACHVSYEEEFARLLLDLGAHDTISGPYHTV
jgi:hypothetical protein